jgi:predicted aspartyl protease
LIIRGYFGKKYTEAYIPAIVVCDGLNFVELMRFLVDTGASRTSISEGDAIRYGIQHSHLEKSGTALGIGGTATVYNMKNVLLAFRKEGEVGLHRVRLQRVGVLKHSAKKKQLRNRLRVLPSLLGRDVLDRFELIRRKDTLILLK